jgi:hypothetical protein
MTTISIQFDQRQIGEAQKLLGDAAKGLPTAMMRAINRTAISARAEIVRRIAGRVRLSQAELRRRNVFLHLTGPEKLRAEVNIRGRMMKVGRKFAPIPAAPSPRRQRALPGSSYEVLRGTRTVVPHGFTARMASGHIGVFLRAGPRPLPIRDVRTPTVPELVEDVAEIAGAAMREATEEKLAKNLQSQIGLLLARRSG